MTWRTRSDTGGAASDGGIVQNTSAGEIVAYFATTAGGAVACHTYTGISAGGTFSLGRKTEG